MTKDNVAAFVEGILFRRILANRLIGYTLETSVEIAEDIPSLRDMFSNADAKRIAELEHLVQVGKDNNAALIGFMRDAVENAMKVKS